MRHVETIKFNKGTSGLYRQQKRKVAEKECRHLKGTYQADINQGDMFITAKICKACGNVID